MKMPDLGEVKLEVLSLIKEFCKLDENVLSYTVFISSPFVSAYSALSAALTFLSSSLCIPIIISSSPTVPHIEAKNSYL